MCLMHMKFDMTIIGLLLISFLQNVDPRVVKRILRKYESLHIYIIVRNCRNKKSHASTEAENKCSNSHFLFLSHTFMYLEIPINDLVGMEAEGRHKNAQPKVIKPTKLETFC